jgi:flagellar hook-length control protein FliK
MGSANNTVGAIFPYSGQGTAALNVSSGQNLRTEKEKSGFESIFNMVSDASSQKNTIAREVKGKDLETAGTKIDTARQNKRPEIVETEGKEANKELQNAISEDGKKLIKQIAEETDLSEEEIVSAMEMLGFNASDLLKPENMIQLFNQLSSEEDGLNIILNPELSDSLNKLLESVNEIRNDLFEEFNIAPEELNSYIESFEEMTDAVTTISKLPIKQSVEIPTEKEETAAADISELSEEKNPQNYRSFKDNQGT